MCQDKSDQPAKKAVRPTGDTLAQPPAPPPASFWQRWWTAFLSLALLIAAAAALAVDCPLAQWRRTCRFPGELQNLLQTCEPFGDGLGVLVIVLAIHQLDPVRRWALPRILVCSLGAGLAANAVKLLVVRARPRNFDFQGGVWATFQGWLPVLNTDGRFQSFPSGHVATAAGLAAALIWLYPSGRWLFPAIAVLVAGHRIEAQAHYLSDVLCGAAVGVIVATGCLRTGRLARWFDRLEDRWRSSSKPPPASG